MHFEDLDGLESIVLGTADSASMRTRNALMSIFRGTDNGSDSVAIELARLRTQNVYPVTGLHRQRRGRNRIVLGTTDSASLRNRNHFGDLEGLTRNAMSIFRGTGNGSDKGTLKISRV